MTMCYQYKIREREVRSLLKWLYQNGYFPPDYLRIGAECDIEVYVVPKKPKKSELPVTQ